MCNMQSKLLLQKVTSAKLTFNLTQLLRFHHKQMEAEKTNSRDPQYIQERKEVESNHSKTKGTSDLRVLPSILGVTDLFTADLGDMRSFFTVNFTANHVI